MKYHILSSTLYQQFGLRNGHRHWLFRLSPFGPYLCPAENLERILLGIGQGGSEYEPSALDSLGRNGCFGI